MRFSVYSLFSGSGGNSTYIRCGNDAILIDAGRSCRAIVRALAAIDVDLCDISALFLTHNHSDHTSGVDVLCRKHPTLPVYLTDACQKASVFADSTLAHLHTLTPDESVQIGALSLTPFALPHDSADCVGYRVESCIRTLGYATDIGYPTQSMMTHLRGCDYVVLESNHDVAKLQNGPYPASLKARILSRGGHLSNDDAARCACDLVQNGTRRLLLAHLSEENNTPDLALTAVRGALAQSNKSAKIKVGEPNQTVCLIDRDLER